MRQDRQSVRTPTDIERKYNLGNLSSQGKLNEERLNNLVQSLSVLEKAVRDITGEVEELFNIKADKTATYSKTEVDMLLENIRALLPGYGAEAILDEAVLDMCVLC